LSIEAIRTTLDGFKKFDAILKSNPNGRISTSAYEVADSRKIKVLWWRELLGELNKKWS
jgi:hypothetical protein